MWGRWVMPSRFPDEDTGLLGRVTSFLRLKTGRQWPRDGPCEAYHPSCGRDCPPHRRKSSSACSRGDPEMARAYSNLLQSPAPPGFCPFLELWLPADHSTLRLKEGLSLVNGSMALWRGNAEVALWLFPVVCASGAPCLLPVTLPFTQNCSLCIILYNGLCRSQLAEAHLSSEKAVRAMSPYPFPAHNLWLIYMGIVPQARTDPCNVSLPVFPLLPIWIEQKQPFLHRL